MNSRLISGSRQPIDDGDNPEPRALHRRLPTYERSPLREGRALAARTGVAEIWVKDESSRLGLPSFKILGASWAIFRRLRDLARDRAGVDIQSCKDLSDLTACIQPLKPLTLAAATDGNHGHAVARIARLLGLDAHIFVPSGTAKSRIEAIRGERAEVTVVPGTYDEAVRRSAQSSDDHWIVISDTSWPGYEDVPRWVIEGYSTIFFEVDEQLREMRRGDPDLILVQIGVGALAAALVRHYRRPGAGPGPTIIGVEPNRAACVLESMKAGHPTTIPGPHDSIMAGLNCGTPSIVAWPYVSRGIDFFLSIDDERAREAMKALALEGIVSGETGAAGLGGLLELLARERFQELGATLNAKHDARVLLISTEGATDPNAYRHILKSSGRSPTSHVS